MIRVLKKMANIAAGKVKIPIEIQHLNGDVTFCFVFVHDPENLYEEILSIKEFLPVMILSKEIIFISKADIKAFRSFEGDNIDLENGYIWSFDPYRVLGVKNDISMDDLHTKYITLLKKIHPDIVDDTGLHYTFKEVASDITRRVINAYEFIRTEKISKGENNE